MEKLKLKLETLKECVTVTKADGILALLIALLSGCIVGMLISPRKNQTIGCGNGCNSFFGDYEEEYEEEMD